MIAGTKAETVIGVIEKIPLKHRNLVKEITLDMAGNIVTGKQIGRAHV